MYLQIPADVIEALNCPEFCSGNGRCDIPGRGGCLCDEEYEGYSCDKRIINENAQDSDVRCASPIDSV